MGNLCGEHCLGGFVCDQALCQVAQRVGLPIAGARVLHQANNLPTAVLLWPKHSTSAAWVLKHIKACISTLWSSCCIHLTPHQQH